MKLYELTAHEISDLLRNKEISIPEVVQSTIDRIDQVDSKLESFLTVCKNEAMETATAMQKKLDDGTQSISPLLGIPMALKDNICTKNIRTTCASKILYNFIPPYNATVVNKLKSQGSILLGKLNLDEFAMGSSTENSGFQKTKNPWDISKVPGGSSGGAAASVAAGEAIFSLGSDTGGSVRQPGAFCGVVGLRPTYGTVSRFGLVAFSSSLDQIGPLTKDVTDCALVMNAITGYDAMDSTSINMRHPDYTKALTNDIKGLKLGIPTEYLAEGTNDEVKSAVLSAAETLRSMGAEIEECSLPLTEYAIPVYYIIAPAEASSNLARYDGIKYGYRSDEFDDLLDLYKKTRSNGFGAEVKRRIMIGTYVLSSGYYDAYYNKALRVRTLIRKQFEDIFKKFDALICPTTPTTAYNIGEKSSDPIEMYLSDIYTVSANIADVPAISVPCGFDSKNLPIGLQIIGKSLDESMIIRIAYAFESNTEFHKKRATL